MRVSVIGSSTIRNSETSTAESVGRLLARNGHILVCGGLGGVMEAACRGASEVGGTTVGILPGDDPSASNPYVDVPIATGIGHARNALVVMNGDAVIAIDGAGGTCSELGYAAVYDRPAAGLGTHDLEWITPVETPEAAVEYVERAVDVHHSD